MPSIFYISPAISLELESMIGAQGVDKLLIWLYDGDRAILNIPVSKLPESFEVIGQNFISELEVMLGSIAVAALQQWLRVSCRAILCFPIPKDILLANILKGSEYIHK
jgi:hypothetical protein